jgi:long-chain acyl-CoA synthetase
MQETDNLISYLDQFLRRGGELAFAHRRGLRTFRWSYEEVALAAHQFAHLLESRQLVKGDRVLLCGWDGPEWVAAFFGCILHGAVVVPLEVQSEAGFVDRVQHQVRAKLAIFDARARQTFYLDLPVVELEELEEFRDATLQLFPRRQLSVDETVEIVFTSGTTAEPKGVVITHGNLLANLQPLERGIRPYLKWERIVHPIRFLNLLPLSHVFGQFMGIFVPQLLGGQVFFSCALKPSEITQTVKSEKISVIVCVPRMLEIMREWILGRYEARGEVQKFLKAVESAGKWNVARRWWVFREVHRIFGFKFWAFIAGGATLNAETEAFWHRLGFAIIQGYGMTETAALISLNHPFKLGRGSIGKVMPGQKVRLAGNGEILVRGANVSGGYWPKGTGEERHTLIPAVSEAGNQELQEGLDEQGWFHTGDMGELDDAGNLYFKGRMKEVIVTAAGLNVYPKDLEAALDRQPEIKMSAVLGIDGPRGPEPVAVVILRDRESDVKLLIDRANQSLAESQRIRRWFVWPREDFPRTSTQKIRKQLIAEEITAGLGGKAAGAEPSSELTELLRKLTGEGSAGIDPSAKLGDELKLDSLGRVELLSLLEDRYQVEINEAAFSADTTVGEMENIIHTAKHETREYPYPH